MWGRLFYRADPDFTVYFTEGKAGFTTPKWQGYRSVAVPPVADIGVQQPAGSGMLDGSAKRSFGTVLVGQSGTAKTFTIVNTGTANLTGLLIAKDGGNAPNFTVTDPLVSTLAPGATTTFQVTFKPTAVGTRNAAIHISSNDPDENPFDIEVTGMGVR